MLFKLLILGFFFAACLGNSQAQDPVFYYFSEQSHHPDPEIGPEDLFRQGQQILYSDPNTARAYAQQALQGITAGQFETMKLQIINFIGITYMIQSAYDSALQYFHEAVAEGKKTGLYVQVGNSYNNIAVVHSDLGNYKDALQYYLQALEVYERSGRNELSAAVYTNIGKIYAEIDNRDKALENFHAARNIFFSIQDSTRLATVFVSMSEFSLRAGKLEKAMLYADSAVLFIGNHSDHYILCSALEVIGRIHFSRNDHVIAREFFINALQMAREIGFHTGEISVWITMAELAMAEEDSQLALENAEKALDIARQIENNKFAWKAHELLSRIHHHRGDALNAYDHFLAYYRIKNESVSQNRLHQVYNLELERAAQISMREIEQRELLLTRKNTTIVLISIAFILVMVIMGLLYYIHLNRQKQKEKKQKALQQLRLTEERAKASLKAELSERRRLGFELHDGAAPLLSLARMNVSALMDRHDISNDRKTRLLSHTIDTLDQLIEEMKNLSKNMTSMVLFEKGMEAALRDIADKVNETGELNVSLEISGLNGGMETFVEHTLFRAVQEAMNNIISHANATNIHMQVIGTHEDITIMIEDNGRGFDAGQKQGKNAKGMGLNSIASRIEGLHGEFFIDSVLGRGTILTIIVPLQ
ncbi:MAG: tetratricopeptide repeat protein [Bacteroidales bacterium]